MRPEPEISAEARDRRREAEQALILPCRSAGKQDETGERRGGAGQRSAAQRRAGDSRGRASSSSGQVSI